MRVLILHASAGAGHKRAAEAVAKAFLAEQQPAPSVTVRDILDFTSPLFRQTYARGYLDLVRKAPELWGYVYARTDRKAREPWRRKVRAIFNNLNARSFFRFLKKFQPDTVVCTHFMPLELLATAKRRRKIAVPLYCVVTDFAVHALWMMDNVNAYYVAGEEARRHLIRSGCSADAVKVTGIPIDPAFSTRLSQDKARRQLGLPSNLPVVLILSGGFGVGPTVELIRSFRGSTKPCQLVVVAGTNDKLRKEAEAAGTSLTLPVRVFGFINNIHELMDASDVVISKPGGLTSSESLAKGKPMIVIDPIPGQEQRNCEHLLESGTALRLYDVRDAPDKADQLLSDRKRLDRMRVQAECLGRPFAARDIVRDILKRSANR